MMVDPTKTEELLGIIAALIPLAIWVISSAEQRLAPLRRRWQDDNIRR